MAGRDEEEFKDELLPHEERRPDRFDAFLRHIPMSSTVTAKWSSVRVQGLRAYRRWFIIGAVVLFTALVVGALAHGRSESSPFHQLTLWRPWATSREAAFIKPKDVRIVGLVFFGRRQFVDILDCYLRQNLVVNHGFLDEVHFLANTNDEGETPWLENLIATSPEIQPYYKIFDYGNTSFSEMWNHCDEPDTIYIKIDDDIVYIHEDAIPHMVNTLINHPESYTIQANIVNTPFTHWLHWHTDATHPWLPVDEKITPSDDEWRVSDIPTHTGKTGKDVDYYGLPDQHRWAPVGVQSDHDMESTPIMKSQPGIRINNGYPQNPWEIGAQEHYSLLQNIENDRIDLYWAGNKEGIWNVWYEHYSICFMAITGKQVAEFDPKTMPYGDEWAMTEFLPKSLGQSLRMDSHAVVGHYANFLQREGMLKTDLLDRYRALANDRVCGPNNQKVAFDVNPTCSIAAPC